MKSRLLQTIVAVATVFALCAGLTAWPYAGGIQQARAGPPGTPTPTPVSPVKTVPDTYIPAAANYTPRPLGVTQTVVPGAMRDGFEGNYLYPNDDGSTDLVGIGFPINFFGTTYSQLYVNNNGNVTFDSSMSTYTPFNIVTAGRVIIAPFFADVDTRSAGQPTRYGTGTVDGRPAFGATWRDVDYYSSSASHTNRNHFQVVLIDRSDVAAGDFDIEFNYNQIQWEAGEASNSDVNGLGGSSARAGYSNGAAAAFELSGSAVNGAFLDSNPATGLSTHSFNSNQPGRYVYHVRGGNTAAALTTDTVNLNVGTDAVANVFVQNVPAVGLGSYSLVVTYDAAVVSVTSVADGDAPFGAPSVATINNTAGTVTLQDAVVGSAPSGTIVLARLNLHGAANGSTTLGITVNELIDSSAGSMGHMENPGVATVSTPAVILGQASVVEGGAVDVQLSVQGLAGQSLASYEVTVSFDNAIVGVNSISGGPFPFGGPSSLIDNTAGTATISQTATEPIPTGNILLVMLNIQGIAAGAGNLNVIVASLTNSSGQPIIHTAVPGSVSVTPAQSPLHHIVVTPADPTLTVGGSQTFTAEGFDEANNPIQNLTFEWTCASSDAGTIDPLTGEFIAGTLAGAYPDAITAASGEVAGSASVTVVAGPLHHVVVSPDYPTAHVGGCVNFTAQGFDEYDNARGDDVFAWTVIDPAAGSIDPSTGVFTAGSTLGDYYDVVLASSGEMSGVASVSVVAAPLRGDVNADGRVDLLDLAAVVAAFNSAAPLPNWNPAADLNGDGMINIFDLVIVGLNYGAGIPT